MRVISMKHFTFKSKYVLKVLAPSHVFTCLSPMIYKYQSHAHKAYIYAKSDDIRNIWREHFETVLNRPIPPEEDLSSCSGRFKYIYRRD